MVIENIHAIFRPNQRGLKKILGDLEAEIMEAVWQANRSVSSKDIHPLLPDGQHLSYSTIVCTMTVLTQKNLLQVVEKKGRSRVYLPTLSREDFLHGALGHVLGNIMEAFPDTALALLTERTQEGSFTKLQQLAEQVEALKAEWEP